MNNLASRILARITDRPKGWDTLGDPHDKCGAHRERIIYREVHATTIRPETVGRALDRLPRFGGHWGDMTIAQHSLHVVEILDREGADLPTCLLGLIHDADEAYIGDISTPLKGFAREVFEGFGSYLSVWRDHVEQALWPTLAQPITQAMRDAVKAADRLAHSQELDHYVLGLEPAHELANVMHAPRGVWVRDYRVYRHVLARRV